jgi:hypothetical protein
MKTNLLFLYILLMAGLTLAGQNLKLSWHGGVISNGAIIDASCHPDSSLIVEVYLQNIATTIKDVKVRKYDVSILSGSVNAYCFAGQCYGGSTPVSSQGVQLGAGKTDSSFTGDYYPLGHDGVTQIMYTFFDVNDANDTVSLTIRYNGTVGIAKAPLSSGISNPYPNPATDKVSFDYTPSALNQGRILILRDMTGRTVREVVIPSGYGTVELDLSGVENGILFYSIIQDNTILLTKKLVVKK